MATVTPAQILYPAYDEAGIEIPRGDERQQRIDFHSVVAEVHGVKAEITGYPVQSGFHVSNNSIRKNRAVTITAAITNHNVEYHGTEQNFGTNIEDDPNYNGKYRNYGLNASKTVFQELEGLVIDGTECKVITNLGEYLPVVFNNFSTQQKDGFVDSMEFTLSGEEVLVVDTGNTTGSVPASFTVLTGAERDAELQRMASEGFKTSNCDQLATASIPPKADFHIDGVNSAGVSTHTTFTYEGDDPTTGEATYSVVVDKVTAKQREADTGTTEEPVPSPCAPTTSSNAISNTAMQASDCIVDKATDIAVDAVLNTVDSALGKLEDGIKGLVYDTTSFGDSAASALATASIGCVVRSVTGNDTPGGYVPGESLPTAEQMLEGLLAPPKPRAFTLTRLLCACEGSTTPDIQEVVPV